MITKKSCPEVFAASLRGSRNTLAAMFFFKWDRSSDNGCHGFGTEFLLLKLVASGSCYPGEPTRKNWLIRFISPDNRVSNLFLKLD